MHYKETQYGFEYGAASVTRLFSNEKHGWIVLGIRTPKADVQVYVTRTGKIRVWKGRKELKEGKDGQT